MQLSMEPLIAMIHEAGALIMSLQPDIVRLPSKRHVKQDGSFVTKADTQSLQLMVKKLRVLTPHIPIVAEEQPADVNKTILENGETYWLVDSLDNTRDYALGGNNFSINVALIDKGGISKLGLLFFPGLGELYYTGDDGSAYRQYDNEAAEKMHVLGFKPNANEVLTVAQHPVHREHSKFFAGKPVRFITSRGQRRACMVATGEVSLCIETEGFYIWDTAPIAAILKAAGGGVYNIEDGEYLTFNAGLRLPAYAASASRDIPERMELFGLHGLATSSQIALQKSKGA